MSQGVISYFNTRQPTEAEINDPNKYIQIELTLLGDWDPYSQHFEEAEHDLLVNQTNPYVKSSDKIRQINPLTTS
jgi:hypothetical protein